MIQRGHRVLREKNYPFGLQQCCSRSMLVTGVPGETIETRRIAFGRSKLSLDEQHLAPSLRSTTVLRLRCYVDLPGTFTESLCSSVWTEEQNCRDAQCRLDQTTEIMCTSGRRRNQRLELQSRVSPGKSRKSSGSTLSFENPSLSSRSSNLLIQKDDKQQNVRGVTAMKFGFD